MRLHYEVFGKVQGVGFRMSTISVAEQISGLTGYVRNTDTRTVEGEVQGPRELLQQFIAALERSPAGKVSRVDIKILAEVPGEGEFRALDASFYREHRRMLSNPRRCLRV